MPRLQPELSGRKAALEAAAHLPQHRRQVDGFGLEAQLPAGDAGDVEQLVDSRARRSPARLALPRRSFSRPAVTCRSTPCTCRSMAASGVRSSWEAMERNASRNRTASLASARAASRWARTCRCSSTSVLVPNQRTISPAALRTGLTRVRKCRKRPSAPRRGKVISNGCPLRIDVCQRSSTRGSSTGSCTLCQPQPSISGGVVPVYSYQRWLYQWIYPSARATQAS